MKILCDVCDKDEASFFCVADEAPLCAACDHRVHHANKLARKHHRFSLLPPCQPPLCDICQERRGFLFCQQHRAILCKDCDIPIHSANEHTQKHARFLLTGVRLSPTCTFYSPPPPSSAESAVPIGIADRQDAPSPAKGTTPQCTTVEATSSNAAISASSIAEYLIEMLPGWHVEDLLDASSPSPSAFCQSGENEMLPIWDGDFHQNMGVFPPENMGLGVPQDQSFQSTDVAFGLPNGYGDQRSKGLLTTNSNSIKLSSRKRSDDNSFAVPQISQSTASIKRSRNFW